MQTEYIVASIAELSCRLFRMLVTNMMITVAKIDNACNYDKIIILEILPRIFAEP